MDEPRSPVKSVWTNPWVSPEQRRRSSFSPVSPSSRSEKRKLPSDFDGDNRGSVLPQPKQQRLSSPETKQEQGSEDVLDMIAIPSPLMRVIIKSPPSSPVDFGPTNHSMVSDRRRRSSSLVSPPAVLKKRKLPVSFDEGGPGSTASSPKKQKLFPPESSLQGTRSPELKQQYGPGAMIERLGLFSTPSPTQPPEQAPREPIKLTIIPPPPKRVVDLRASESAPGDSPRRETHGPVRVSPPRPAQAAAPRRKVKRKAAPLSPANSIPLRRSARIAALEERKREQATARKRDLLASMDLHSLCRAAGSSSPGGRRWRDTLGLSPPESPSRVSPASTDDYMPIEE
ncbi:hypothetical protein NKR23_g2753 [Pleurostoma richardsiae]|uniref:Uncharacterized protein n=1 Tax=Pleurostoma richardsiae TaxID=41990 RepID=A0AA38VHY6_9PEZI|nr:hypothetical protein NKR23_g2753 [Pleurostoma richardsiae]